MFAAPAACAASAADPTKGATVIDVNTPEGRIFRELARRLHDRRTGRAGGRKWRRDLVASTDLRPGLDLLEQYRRGDPPLRDDIHTGWKPYVRRFVRMGRLNQADLIISTTANRLQLRDFRTAAADDELGDIEARRIMRLNDMAVVSREITTTTLTMGEGYGLVTPPTSARKYALITAEDPRQMYVSTDPATREPRYGLKLFRGEWDDEDIAYLYLPDGKVRTARRSGRTSIHNGAFRFDHKSWTFDDKTQETPGGRFPIAVFANRDGVGEFEYHLDTLDRINDKIFDEWWIAKIQAFRQRAVKNLPETKLEPQSDGSVQEVPIADDEYDAMFTASPDEMWQVPGDVDFWESQPVDLTPITNSIEKDRARLASSTHTPLQSITPDAAQGSAEGASLLREEHTFKCWDRRDRLSGGFSRLMSLALEFEGDTERAKLEDIEPMWAPVVRHSLSEMGSAAAQAKESLPVDIIRRDIWQYSPSEVQEMRNLDGADLLRRLSGSA